MRADILTIHEALESAAAVIGDSTHRDAHLVSARLMRALVALGAVEADLQRLEIEADAIDDVRRVVGLMNDDRVDGKMAKNFAVQLARYVAKTKRKEHGHG